MNLNLLDINIRESLEQVLDFLPYPFLIAEERDSVYYNLHVNQKFLDEIGYTINDIPSVRDWFNIAYPDEVYRQAVIEEWNKRFTEARVKGLDAVQMKVVIHTRVKGDVWYEVKSSVIGRFQLVAFVTIHEAVIKEQSLQQLNTTNHQVLSVLSHDLRAPLISMNALTRLALRSSLTTEEFLSLVPKLHERSRQTLDLLDTTLYWAKSNFHEIKISYEPVDVQQVVDSVVQAYESSYKAKNIVVTTFLSSHSPITDKEILTIVLRNLLSNAIKFTPEGGSIRVVSQEENNLYTLCVEDTGVGLLPEDLDRIIRENYLSKKGTHEEKGHGIGLRLCRQLLRKMNGNLVLKSEVGKGTHVYIYLPQS
jgi:signal transduction histidine kinase